MTNFLVRKYERALAAEVGEEFVEKRSSAVEIGKIETKADAKKFLDRFSKLQKDVYDKGEIIAAKRGGEYVGGVILKPPKAIHSYEQQRYKKHGVTPDVAVSNFIVSPSERGKGIGGRLLAEGTKGRGTVVLGTDNRGEHTDAAALHLYEKSGFKPVKRERRSTFWVKTASELRPAKGEFAPGIRRGRRIDQIPDVPKDGPNKEWTVSLSKHPAAVRGDHLDLRLVDDAGRAHSWALQHLPKPGERAYAAQTATHSKKYALRKKPFSIPTGVYGGTRPGAKVEPVYVQPAEVLSANNKKIRFQRQAGSSSESFVLRRVAESRGTPLWLLHNTTTTGKLVKAGEAARPPSLYLPFDPEYLRAVRAAAETRPTVKGMTLLARSAKKGIGRVKSYIQDQKREE